MDFLPSDSTEGKIATDDTHTTAVFSPYTGRITRVMAKVGDHVRAGQPLFAVNAAEFVQGQSDLLTAGAQVRLAKATLERQEALLKESGAAVKDVQQAQSDYATALANLEAARNRLRVLGMSAAQIAETEAAVGRRGIVPDTVVVSPISGVVSQRSVGPGQNLACLANNGGGTPALTISVLSRVWLVGVIREADAPLARVGQMADVLSSAFMPGRVFRARVRFRLHTVRRPDDPPGHRPRLDSQSGRRTEARHVRDLRPDHRPRAPGSSACPAEAVIYEGDTARVWVARSDWILGLRSRSGRAKRTTAWSRSSPASALERP